jgi:hypothetical protein
MLIAMLVSLVVILFSVPDAIRLLVGARRIRLRDDRRADGRAAVSAGSSVGEASIPAMCWLRRSNAGFQPAG